MSRRRGRDAAGEPREEERQLQEAFESPPRGDPQEHARREHARMLESSEDMDRS
jgi:hypothetical protein